VSVAEFPTPVDERPSYDRTPPQDVAAEQSVLGAMLISKDAIADVVEVVRGHDFYRPAHETIYDTIVDLYGRGEPADAITVSDELTKRGELARLGGSTYLHTLTASVPTAANADYYAMIVRERAVLRRLVEAGTRIVQMGYGQDGEVDDIVDRAQAEVYAVTDRRTSEDYAALGDIMEGALDEIEAIGSRGGAMVGVPTGFGDLDSLTNGLHPGQLIVVAARPGIGKALAIDTPLPTPTGWTTMGQVTVGEWLLGADGRPTQVVAATEVMHDRPCFTVEFTDGSAIVADAEHQWLTQTGAGRGSVKTTAQIAATLRGALADPYSSHAVSTCAPLALPTADLVVPPYTLGVWLGGREGALDTRDEPVIRAQIEAEDSGRSADNALLRAATLGHGHIPDSYLRASQSQRRALLAGLLDSSGRVTPAGAVELTSASQRLVTTAQELVLSLGYRCDVTDARTLTFHAHDDVFRLGRKQLAHKERASRNLPVLQRSITGVKPVTSVPVRCVQVSSPDHLYLAGRSMIPTHNSTLALDFARAAAIKNRLTSVMFSLEMTRNEITMRLLSAEARVALHHMRTGQMSDEDWNRIARRTGEVSSAPLFLDDSPNMSMMEIRAKARRLKQRHDLRLIVVDYLQLMQSSKKVESRQVEVAEFSRSLKLLAKELEVPVVALSQLNRGPEQRADKKPMLSDLRESGSIEQDSDMVILLHREDAYEKESPRAGEADLIVAKHRNGPTATITVAFQGHYSRFVDMAQG